MIKKLKASPETDEANIRFQGTFEQAAVGIAHVGLDGKFNLVNQKLCEIVGYGRDEFGSLRFQDITFPADLDVDLALVNKVLNDEIQTYTLEKRYIKKSGLTVWINLTVSLVRKATGQPEYFIAVIEDIQARKKTEEELKAIRNELEKRVELRTSELISANQALTAQVEQTEKAKKELDRFFNLSIDHFAISDTDGKFLVVNPAFTHTLGYSAEELTSRTFLDFVHPDDRNVTISQSEGLKDGVPVLEFENRYFTKSGEIRWFSWKAFPALDEGLVYAAARDITEIRSKELLIEKQRHDIIESSRLNSLGRMAAGIAHEINNPLAVLYLEAFKIRELAESNSLNQKAVLQSSARIEEMTWRMTSIIKGLKSFARDSSGDPFEAVSVRKIIEDSLLLCDPEIRQHQVKLISDSNYNDVFVSGREVQLAQVLVNLFNNSVDAVRSKSDRCINVEVVELEKFVEINVTDSGLLTDTAIIAKIFDPFFTTKTVGEGTGLGLSISLGIVREHGGDLVFNNASKNTKFTIRLPKLID